MDKVQEKYAHIIELMKELHGEKIPDQLMKICLSINEETETTIYKEYFTPILEELEDSKGKKEMFDLFEKNQKMIVNLGEKKWII